MTANQPENLYLLPSFISQDLSPDGVHLSAVSGLHYVIHLFDQAEAVLALAPREPELKLVKVQEAVRQHDDRLSYLEGRHGTLQGNFSLKVATDHEFKDWMTNRSEEDWLTVLGLPRLGQMTSREWQVAAKKQVSDLIKVVLGINRARIDYAVLYVSNPVRHRPAGKPVLNVRLSSVHSAVRIRELWSGFFRRVNPLPLPQEYRGVEVRNKVTLATRIRIRILQQFANNYVASNPGASAVVKGFEPRPMLVTTPPRGQTNLRQRSFNFVEACTALPALFSDDGLAKIFQVVGTHHQGELRSIFIVLSDDDRERCMNLVKNYQPRAGNRGRSAPTATVHFAGAVTGSGSGMELQNVLNSLRSPPPPPPPPRSSSLAPRKGSRSCSTDSQLGDPKSQRGLKRARQPSRERDRDAKRVKWTRRSSGSGSGSSSDERRKKKKRKSKRRTRRHSSSSPSTSSMSDRKPQRER